MKHKEEVNNRQKIVFKEIGLVEQEPPPSVKQEEVVQEEVPKVQEKREPKHKKKLVLYFQWWSKVQKKIFGKFFPWFIAIYDILEFCLAWKTFLINEISNKKIWKGIHLNVFIIAMLMNFLFPKIHRKFSITSLWWFHCITIFIYTV